jgi:hypothetical protein
MERQLSSAKSGSYPLRLMNVRYRKVGTSSRMSWVGAKQPVMAERRQSLVYRLRNGCVQLGSVRNRPVRR